MTNKSGQLMFFLKFQGLDEADLITAKEAYVMCPQLILEFYKEKLTWHDGDDATPPNKPRKRSTKSEKSDVNENGVAAGKVPEKILGATDSSGQLKFLIKWRGVEEGDLIVANAAHIMCPQLLLKWYEERISWTDSK